MKTKLRLITCLIVVVLSAGCRRAATCTVTQYGPEYMTYSGSHERFNDACREVVHEIGYKEKVSENTTRYPYYGEGSSSHKDKDRLLSVRIYLRTKDEAGAEYKVTIVRLGRRDPFVTLESTSSDRFKLINALNAEFSKRGIEVREY